MKEEIVDVVRLFPQEGIHQRTAEEIVMPAAQIQKQMVQVGKVFPRERLS